LKQDGEKKKVKEGEKSKESKESKSNKVKDGSKSSEKKIVKEVTYNYYSIFLFITTLKNCCF